VVTGRGQFLIAYNINLGSEDIAVAKRIAQRIGLVRRFART
jgi:glutamate formiminotransferase